MNKEITTIQIKKETRDLLKAFALNKSETYDDTIKRLATDNNKLNKIFFAIDDIVVGFQNDNYKAKTKGMELRDKKYELIENTDLNKLTIEEKENYKEKKEELENEIRKCLNDETVYRNHLLGALTIQSTVNKIIDRKVLNDILNNKMEIQLKELKERK